MKLARFPILLLCPLMMPACQRYAPSPLNLPAHHAGITARDPFAPEVVAYAERLAVPSTQPSQFDAGDGLSLAEAEAVALLFNPELRLARLKADVPRVGAAEAGRWEDPQLGIDGERIINGVENPWVLGGMLSLTIPISGRLSVERDKARSEATAGELRALAEERRVLAELRAAWAQWSAATERAALTRQFIAELEPVVERAERLRTAGELDPVDTRLLRIERVSQTAKLHGYEADARAAEVELKARLGLLPTADVKLVASISTPSGIGLSPMLSEAHRRDAPAIQMSRPLGERESGDAAAAALFDRARAEAINQHPRVRLARAEYEIAERTLKLEIRKQYPDLNIGGGFGTDEGDERVLFGASLPLPLFNANRRAIAEARAGREVARAAAEFEYVRLLAEASVAQVRLDAANERLAYVEKELAPIADEQVADARRLAQLGDFNTLVLLEALKAAHEAKLEVLDTRLNLTFDARRLEALLEGGSHVNRLKNSHMATGSGHAGKKETK